jgi:hypothetical protein
LKTQRIGVALFLFGIPGKIGPNAIFKKIAEEISRRKNAIIFSQRGITFAFNFSVEYAEGDDKSPTLKIAEQAAEWAWRNGLKKIIVVAAGPHARRCKRDIEASLREKNLSIEVSICPEACLYADEYWFCKESGQFRTRHKWYWRIREWVLMRMPFRIYKLIAS